MLRLPAFPWPGLLWVCRDNPGETDVRKDDAAPITVAATAHRAKGIARFNDTPQSNLSSSPDPH